MFNINARLGSSRYNLTSLSRDMGMSGDRDDVPANGAAKAAKTPETPQAPVVTGESDALAEARRRLAEQRKAAEALLREARALEEKLLSETSAAHQARERTNESTAVLHRALAAEQEAREKARVAGDQHAAVTTERKQIEAVLTASRLASEAATAEIADLKKRLEDVMRVATDASTLMHAQEQRANTSSAKVAAAEKELAGANAELSKCQAARETAERDAKAAEDRASSFGTIPQKTPQARPVEQAKAG